MIIRHMLPLIQLDILFSLQTHDIFGDGAPAPSAESPTGTHRGSEMEDISLRETDDISLWEKAIKRDKIQIRTHRNSVIEDKLIWEKVIKRDMIQICNHTGQPIVVMTEWTVEKKLMNTSKGDLSASATLKVLREYAYNRYNILHVERIGAERLDTFRVDLPRRTSAIVTACKSDDPTQVYCYHRLVKPGTTVTLVADSEWCMLVFLVYTQRLAWPRVSAYARATSIERTALPHAHRDAVDACCRLSA
jgi:hypothetical protein